MQPLLLCSVDAGASVQGNEDTTAPVCLGMRACMLCSTRLLHAMHVCVRFTVKFKINTFFFPSSFFQNRSSLAPLPFISNANTSVTTKPPHISPRQPSIGEDRVKGRGEKPAVTFAFLTPAIRTSATKEFDLCWPCL